MNKATYVLNRHNYVYILLNMYIATYYCYCTKNLKHKGIALHSIDTYETMCHNLSRNGFKIRVQLNCSYTGRNLPVSMIIRKVATIDRHQQMRNNHTT